MMPRIPQWRIPRPNSVRNDSEADESQADVEEEAAARIQEKGEPRLQARILGSNTG